MGLPETLLPTCSARGFSHRFRAATDFFRIICGRPESVGDRRREFSGVPLNKSAPAHPKLHMGVSESSVPSRSFRRGSALFTRQAEQPCVVHLNGDAHGVIGGHGFSVPPSRGPARRHAQSFGAPLRRGSDFQCCLRLLPGDALRRATPQISPPLPTPVHVSVFQPPTNPCNSVP